MSNIKIDLPKKVYENNFIYFLRQITNSIGYDKVTFDFAKVVFFIPAAWVSLLILSRQLTNNGSEVNLINHKNNPGLFRYLQRIDFFKHFGLSYSENFTRRKQGSRFVPIKKIERKKDFSSSKIYNEIATEVANCLAPEQDRYYSELEDLNEYDEEETGLYDFVEYSVSELSRNVLNHSKSIGFVSAQYTPTTDYVRLGIVDIGIGIRDSFRNTGYWDNGMNDIEAISLALKPEVSSKNDGTNSMAENAGMGLTFMKLLCEKLNGTFNVVSRQGYLTLYNMKTLKFDFPGTVCLLRFKRIDGRSYSAVLSKIKEELDLPKVNFNSKFS